MKTCIQSSFRLLVLLVLLDRVLVLQASAQTFRVLYSFSDESANPTGLILRGNTLYGSALGNVFAVNTDGTGFTNLHSFTDDSDGAGPNAGLVLLGDTLYGTAQSGRFSSLGTAFFGTVFKVNTNGTGFTILHSFTSGDDGAYPSGLILSDNTLYGTTYAGGSPSLGTVFGLNTDGTGFKTIYSFTGVPTSPFGGAYTNSDGALPIGELILSDSMLYGTAAQGGCWGGGTMFKVKTDGSGFMTLGYNFSGRSENSTPDTGFLLSGSTLYGTGGSGNGTVFSVNTDGTDFTTLYSFTALLYLNSFPLRNSDGAYPQGRLILSGNTLYGTASSGGGSGNGTVFALNTDGTGFTILYSFTAGSVDSSNSYSYTNSDGANPYAGLVLSGNILYGTAWGGGNSGNGTVFSLSFTPQMTITRSAANIVLSWPTNYAGFDYTGFTLQSTTNLGSSAAWTTNSPAPVVVNGQNTVTNPISGTQQFFRLSQ